MNKVLKILGREYDVEAKIVAWLHPEGTHIALNPPKDFENWEQVLVTIEAIPENSNMENSTRKLEKVTKNLDRSVKNLVKSTRRWGRP